MRTRLSERIIALLVLLFLIVYVGYQIYSYYYVPLQTETVYQYSVTHSISADGVAVRNEVLIDQPASGSESNMFEDGVRVAKGQAVVEYYSSSASDRQVQQIRALEAEIAALREAQNTDINNYSNADTLNRDIRENIGAMSYMAGTGRFSNMGSVTADTVTLINKKQIAIGKESNYLQRISQLQTQYNELSGRISVMTMDTATAPHSGYFMKTTDGLEHISPASLEEYTFQDYHNLVENASPKASSALVGKIVTSSTWYFIASVPKDNTDWITDGMTIHLEFDTIDETVPGYVQDVLTIRDSDEAILVIEINHVNGDLLSLRKEHATIHIRQYTGLRINTSSIRIEKNRNGDDVRGVYVLSKGTVRFRRIDPVYEDASFVISREDPLPVYVPPTDETEESEEEAVNEAEHVEQAAEPDSASESSADMVEAVEEQIQESETILLPESYDPVALYDQIIVKGRDLYHGKVVE